MLSLSSHPLNESQPALVFMHYLGYSQPAWHHTLPYLSHQRYCVAIDTPGNHPSASQKGYDIQSMVNQVDNTIRALGVERCILIGHAMTSKVAMALAAQHPEYLRGLIVVSPTILSAHQVSHHNYEQNRVLETQQYREHHNVIRLPESLRRIAVHDIQALYQHWRNWPQHAAQEDWSEQIGQLDYPLMMVLGENDRHVPDAETQRKFTLSHFPNNRLEIIANANQLMPMQKPQQLAQLIQDFSRHL